nr:ABC transporter ATP-binding protein [Streptomyces sp. LBUM 1486]
MTIVVGVIIMLVQDWTLGLVILGPAIPVMVTCVIFERKYAEVARLAQDQVGDLTTVVEESVLGIRIVKGFGRHRSQARAFRELSRTLRGTELRKARLLSVIWGVIITLPELAIGAALVLGVVQVADGVLSAGTLVAFLSTALALRWPVDSIGFLLAMSQEAATATERYFEVMDEKPESSARSTPPASTDADIAVTAGATATVGAAAGGGTAAVASPTADGGAPATADATATVGAAAASTASASASGGSESGGRRSARSDGRARSATSAAGSAGARDGGLRFHHVTFRYPDAGPGTTPTLDRVDLHIRPGESMALVGATGSGKTTLTALVPRLHEVTSGRITLDGEDITAMSREELRAKVAVAFEEPTLFSATVGENVLMGAHPDAGETELDRALAIAQAEFAHALPQGTATQVGEQGLSLSGGQRQRLALARAVVGRPRFLVLDDPLSALDVHTEAAVEAALRRVLAETTALIVAHRPSTVLLADRVALLSGGRITAVGTHQELLRTNAEYAHLMSGTEEDER